MRGKILFWRLKFWMKLARLELWLLGTQSTWCVRHAIKIAKKNQ